jgi:predicted nucleotidyltransferase
VAELREILAAYRRGLERIYGDRLVEVVLFGSRARGDACPDSDIDVMVVLKGPVQAGEETRRCSEFRAGLCLEHDVVITSIYMSEDRYRSEESGLLRNVRKEGMPI